jgi:tetratricopeptide (TPR) repeat protein
MSGDPESAISVLQAGLAPDRKSIFQQADALLVFELAWVFLSQRRYEDAAKAFMQMTEINTWSHATYYFIAAGCHWSLGNFEEAQRLLEATPAQIDKRKIGNKDLPTEVFIKKQRTYLEKRDRGNALTLFTCSGVLEGEAPETYWFGGGLGTIDFYQPCRRHVLPILSLFSPHTTDVEMAIFWNTHGRITPTVAQAHITELLSLSPPVTLPTALASTPLASNGTSDAPTPTRTPLDTPDELALRALLLGITHRAAGYPAEARAFLRDAHARYAKIPSSGSTWIGGVALFELAVLELREVQRLEHEDDAANANASESEKSSVNGSSSSDEGAGAEEPSEKEVPGVYGVGGGKTAKARAGIEELRVRVGALALGETARARWTKVLKEAGSLLDAAVSLSGSEVDLSSRLESRIAMLRDEIALKREMLEQR